jgi:integrase/recombinase XerD
MAKIKMPSCKIVIRKDKELLDGSHPVCLRVTFNRRSKYYVLKSDGGTIFSMPNKWNLEIGRFNRNRELNQIIEQYETDARNALNSIKNGEFSFGLFESKYFNQYSDNKVIGFINTIIEKLKRENRFVTAQVYKDTRNGLTESVPPKIKQLQKKCLFQTIILL